jgi:hypothetical protein
MPACPNSLCKQRAAPPDHVAAVKADVQVIKNAFGSRSASTLPPLPVARADEVIE